MQTLRSYSVLLLLLTVVFISCKKTYVNKRMIDGVWNLNSGSIKATLTDLEGNIEVDTVRFEEETLDASGYKYDTEVAENNLISKIGQQRIFTLEFQKKPLSFEINQTKIDTFETDLFNYYSRKIASYDYDTTIANGDTSYTISNTNYFFTLRGELKQTIIRKHISRRVGNYVIKDDSINNENNNFIICSETAYDDSVHFAYSYTYQTDSPLILTNTANFYYEADGKMINLKTEEGESLGINESSTKALTSFTIEIEERSRDQLLIQTNIVEKNFPTNLSAYSEELDFKLTKAGS